MNLAQARALPKSAILVALFLEENGRQPIGKIADATGLSDASVYAALKALRELGHDHDLTHGHKEGTAQVSGGTEAPPIKSELSLDEQLEAAGIWPGPAARLLKLHGPERVTRQLEHHARRLADGFAFKGAPAAYLYAAIVHDYAAPWSPPPGLQEAQEGRRAERRVSPDPRQKLAALSDDEKQQRLAWHAKKRDPQLQAEGRRLAAEWGMAWG